jgi:putative oxidoreductase
MELETRITTLFDTVTEKLGFVPPLVARIGLGVLFVQTGWAKLHSLDQVTAFFRELGIPAASIQAPFVASVELVGGLLLIAGLGARVAAAMLSGTMVVALVTAKRGEIHGIGDLANQIEFAYLALFIWIVVYGAGKASIDHLVRRRLALV